MKKGLIFLIILIPVCMFIMQLTVVRAMDNKTQGTGNQRFILVPDDEWPSQVIFDTIQVCYQGTVRWIAMGSPGLLGQVPPYPIARAMTIHCFCVLDKLRTQYKYLSYIRMLGKDDPQNPKKLPNIFMEKSVECIKKHDTLRGLVVLDPNFNMEDLDTMKQDNGTEIDQKRNILPNDNSGKSDSPEQPKELPTDIPLLNF